MATETRVPLSRDRVLRAALDLADASGVEALTMRRLGEELGFEAMSLYRHVANKQDLLDGMLDLVLAEWQLPDAEGDWTEAIRTSAHSVHDALRRHPWAARLLMTGSHIRPARLRYMDRLLGRLHDAGFDADDDLLTSTTCSTATSSGSRSGRSRTPRSRSTPRPCRGCMQTIPWDDYPHLAEHRDQHMNDGPHREVSAFEVGLDLILDGLQQTLGASSQS